MRGIVVAFSKIVFAIVLIATAMVARVDSARAATGILLYALSSPSATVDYSFGSAMAVGDVNGDGRADVIVGAPALTSPAVTAEPNAPPSRSRFNATARAPRPASSSTRPRLRLLRGGRFVALHT